MTKRKTANVYRPRHFAIEELVPQKIMDLASQGRVDPWWYVDPIMAMFDDWLRERFGKPISVNTYKWGGAFHNRGFRMPDSDVGARLSMHKLALARDYVVDGVPADEVRQDIMDNQKTYLKRGITTIESGDYAPTWCHIDRRPATGSEIFVVSP